MGTARAMSRHRQAFRVILRGSRIGSAQDRVAGSDRSLRPNLHSLPEVFLRPPEPRPVRHLADIHSNAGTTNPRPRADPAAACYPRRAQPAPVTVEFSPLTGWRVCNISRDDHRDLEREPPPASKHAAGLSGFEVVKRCSNRRIRRIRLRHSSMWGRMECREAGSAARVGDGMRVEHERERENNQGVVDA